jgi:hypothetical protein
VRRRGLRDLPAPGVRYSNIEISALSNFSYWSENVIGSPE